MILSSRKLLIIGFIALCLFSASFFVDIQIIVVSPEYGDVTGIFQGVWRVVLGLATIGSFLLGYRQTAEGRSGSNGPVTQVEIGGMGHEIHVHPDGRSEDAHMESLDGMEIADESGEDSAEMDR
jgi:hypothetical protein